jgi:peptidoglycan-associated lipoprotein
MKKRHLTLFALLAVCLAACTQPQIPDPDTQSETVAGSGADSGTGAGGGADTDSMDDGMMEDGEFFEDEVPLTMVIYFDFDQSELRPEYADVIAEHAAGLSRNSRTTIRLEGHADERGSREYNIGLGERRSQTVRRQLLLLGGSSDQISTVSFGEERPAAFGSNEEAYGQNRRVEIRYTN